MKKILWLPLFCLLFCPVGEKAFAGAQPGAKAPQALVDKVLKLNGVDEALREFGPQWEKFLQGPCLKEAERAGRTAQVDQKQRDGLPKKLASLGKLYDPDQAIKEIGKVLRENMSPVQMQEAVRWLESALFDKIRKLPRPRIGHAELMDDGEKAIAQSPDPEKRKELLGRLSKAEKSFSQFGKGLYAMDIIQNFCKCAGSGDGSSYRKAVEQSKNMYQPPAVAASRLDIMLNAILYQGLTNEELQKYIEFKESGASRGLDALDEAVGDLVSTGMVEKAAAELGLDK